MPWRVSQVVQVPSLSASEPPPQTSTWVDPSSRTSTQPGDRMLAEEERWCTMAVNSAALVKLTGVPDTFLHTWKLST